MIENICGFNSWWSYRIVDQKDEVKANIVNALSYTSGAEFNRYHESELLISEVYSCLSGKTNLPLFNLSSQHHYLTTRTVFYFLFCRFFSHHILLFESYAQSLFITFAHFIWHVHCAGGTLGLNNNLHTVIVFSYILNHIWVVKNIFFLLQQCVNHLSGIITKISYFCMPSIRLNLLAQVTSSLKY